MENLKECFGVLVNKLLDVKTEIVNIFGIILFIVFAQKTKTSNAVVAHIFLSTEIRQT